MERKATPLPEEVVELISSMKSACPEGTPTVQQVTGYMDEAARLPNRSAYLKQHAPPEDADLRLNPIKPWAGPVVGYAHTNPSHKDTYVPAQSAASDDAVEQPSDMVFKGLLMCVGEHAIKPIDIVVSSQAASSLYAWYVFSPLTLNDETSLGTWLVGKWHTLKGLTQVIRTEFDGVAGLASLEPRPEIDAAVRERLISPGEAIPAHTMPKADFERLLESRR